MVPALIVFAAVAVALIGVREQMAAPQTAEAETASTPRPAKTAAPAVTDSRTANLRKEADGHYWTTAKVNGVPVRFLVDSGASVVALTTRDARRIGLDVDALPRNAQVSTASGKVIAATAMLDTVAIERVEVEGVQAVVIEDGLEQSLLGMSFLNQLKSWEATPKAIVIRE